MTKVGPWRIRNYRHWRWDRIIVVGWVIFIIFWLAYTPNSDTEASLLILSITVIVIGIIFGFTMENKEDARVSNLVEHAKVELALLDEADWLVEGYLKIIQDFADMGHSGSSAIHSVAILERLLLFQNLTPLTDDPSEWNEVTVYLGGKPTWQNNRNPAAMSEDGGKTYILQSEEGPSEEIHISKSKSSEEETKDDTPPGGVKG